MENGAIVDHVISVILRNNEGKENLKTWIGVEVFV